MSILSFGLLFLSLATYSMCQSQNETAPLISMLDQLPSKLLNMSESDIQTALDTIHFDVKNLIENALKNKLADFLDIDKSILDDKNRTDEVKKVMVEKLVDELNYKLYKLQPNVSDSFEDHMDYFRLSYPEKVELLVKNALKAGKAHLTNWYSEMYNKLQQDNEEEELEDNKELLEEHLVELVGHLFQGIEEFLKKAEKSKCKEFLVFKKKYSCLKSKMAKLGEKIGNFEIEDEESFRELNELKGDFEKLLKKLLMTVDRFFEQNKENDNEVLNHYKKSFYMLKCKIVKAVKKLKELEAKEEEMMDELFDEKDDQEHNSEEEEDTEDEKRERKPQRERRHKREKKQPEEEENSSEEAEDEHQVKGNKKDRHHKEEEQEDDKKVEAIEQFLLLTLKQLSENVDQFFEDNKDCDLKGLKLYKKKLNFIKTALVKLVTKVEHLEENNENGEFDEAIEKLKSKFEKLVAKYFCTIEKFMKLNPEEVAPHKKMYLSLKFKVVKAFKKLHELEQEEEEDEGESENDEMKFGLALKSLIKHSEEFFQKAAEQGKKEIMMYKKKFSQLKCKLVKMLKKFGLKDDENKEVEEDDEESENNSSEEKEENSEEDEQNEVGHHEGKRFNFKKLVQKFLSHLEKVFKKNAPKEDKEMMNYKKKFFKLKCKLEKFLNHVQEKANELKETMGHNEESVEEFDPYFHMLKKYLNKLY